MTERKNVVVGITGGIAAYKMADLVSRLSKNGFNVHVVMTEAATRFITPLTLRTLSNNPVLIDMFEEYSNWKVQHIGVAEVADIMVIAPATANFLAKMRCGLADDLLSTIVLATRAPILVAPSMNTNMLDNPITQDNIKALQDRGTIFIEPAEGELACGVSGRGRLPEVDIIYQNIIDILNSKKDLQGKTVMITAGPTQEDMDPVRFITNRSTGKMGYALAREAINRGARVILVSGPTSLAEPANAEIYRVRSACEMNEICIELFDQVDIVVATAAVADYRPLSYSDQKIKKNDTDDDLTLKLTRNPDILEGLGKRKKHQILIGFAAETSSLIENARAKMQKKNLDYLVANDLTREGAGFGVDTNICSLIFRDGTVKDLPQISKGEVARIIFDNLPAGQVTE